MGIFRNVSFEVLPVFHYAQLRLTSGMTCAEPTSNTEESVLQGLTRRVQKLEAGRC